LQIFQVSFVPQFPRDLDTKKTPPNIEVHPESLGTMLEYCYKGRLATSLHCKLKHIVARITTL